MVGSRVLSLLLVSCAWASVDICQQALQSELNQTISILTGQNQDLTTLERFTNTGKSYNDLGHYESCIRTPQSSYYLLRHQLSRLSLLLGVCVPDTCTQVDLQMMLDLLLEELQLNESGISVNVEVPQEYSISGWFLFMVLLILVLVTLGIVGSYVDYQEEVYKATAITFRNSPSEHLLDIPKDPVLIRLLKCFSLYTNAKKLFSSRSEERTGAISTLECLNGVRVLSMCWVVLGHAFAFRASSAVANIEEMGPVIARWWITLVYSAFFAVDTFFWISGLLMGYLTLVELNKRRGKLGFLGWVFIYIHRYFRIIPLYLFCILAYMWLLPPLGSGPLWSNIDIITNECHEYWWTNLIFVNNFVPGGDGNTCFGIGWYLANDMQCFLIAPVLIYIYCKYPKKCTWLLTSALILASVIITMVIASEHNFNVMFIAPENDSGDFYHNIYVKPYCRLGPYLLGLYTGYLYFHYMSKYGGLESHLRRDALADLLLNWIKETNLGKYVSYSIGASLISFFIFFQRSAYDDWRTNYTTWSKSKNVTFLGFEHVGFAFGLMFIMLPLLFGEIQILWSLLAHKFWTPLARLTFSCFLAHYGLMTLMYSAEDYGVVFNQLTFWTDFLFACVISWLLALPLSLLVEVPFGYVQKLICESLKGTGKKEVV